MKEKVKTARKVHECGKCQEKIKIGQKYTKASQPKTPVQHFHPGCCK
jgi:hypothetical protein